MQKLGRQITKQEIQQIISRHDLNGDGILDYEEFKNMFFDGKELEDEEDSIWTSTLIEVI